MKRFIARVLIWSIPMALYTIVTGMEFGWALLGFVILSGTLDAILDEYFPLNK